MSRQQKEIYRLEQQREKLGNELSEAQNMHMQALEDVKVGGTVGGSVDEQDGVINNNRTFQYSGCRRFKQDAVGVITSSALAGFPREKMNFD